MSGGTAADLFIAGIFDVSTCIARGGCFNASDVEKDGFNAPEAATGKRGSLQLRHGVHSSLSFTKVRTIPFMQ